MFQKLRPDTGFDAINDASNAMGTFKGTITDSRSFLNYTRREYFRRILCNLFGQMVEDGGIPVYLGCTTPTDYHAALKIDLELIKFFAEQSGCLAKAMTMVASFLQFKIIPTGGISMKTWWTISGLPPSPPAAAPTWSPPT